MTIDTSNRNNLSNILDHSPDDIPKEMIQKTLNGQVANTNASPPPSTVNLPFKTSVLKRRNQWDKLFDGFTTMKAISFVVQPVFLLEYFAPPVIGPRIVFGGRNINIKKFHSGK